ncbi:hypothetical protein BVC80_1543g66 [Macleaya cordata]|uniref:Thioredoxin-like fold n=1 Tax=Macleaya cordata TaxID=56857 RepID=A0A200R1N1_MACCD|nr:hypothetical protein BVC80_1543g66 [Macleaya cordata]
MEISGVVFRPFQSFSGDLFNTHSSKPSVSGRSNWVSGDLRLVCSRNLKSVRFSTSGFSNNRRLQFYVSPICGGKKKEMVKEEKKKRREIKQKMKLVKGLCKNLSMYSDQMGFLDIRDDSNDGSEQGKIMSKASEILLVQLLQLRAEEKEIKRKQKEEKAKLLKASIKMKCMNDSDPSSSSSYYSSESSCDNCGGGGVVVNMSSSSDILEIPTKPKLVADEAHEAIQEETTTLTNSSLSKGEQKKITEEDHILLSSEKSCCTGTTGSSSSVVIETSSFGERCRIDVCMGGKCKKMGSEALLAELKSRVGIEGAVVGCNCMGKCRNAPNVRVVSKSFDKNNLSQGKDSSSVRSLQPPSSNPLYLGVGLEDVGTIVANFFGEESRKDLGFMAA